MWLGQKSLCHLVDIQTSRREAQLLARGIVHNDTHFGNILVHVEFDEKLNLFYVEVGLIDYGITEETASSGKNPFPDPQPYLKILSYAKIQPMQPHQLESSEIFGLKTDIQSMKKQIEEMPQSPSIDTLMKLRRRLKEIRLDAAKLAAQYANA